MTAELLTSKIELLDEQIENLERSGFFTETEIDRAVVSLRTELEMYTMHLSYSNQSLQVVGSDAVSYSESKKGMYGMSPEDYIEGMRVHNECFKQVSVNEIDVVDAEILTPTEV